MARDPVPISDVEAMELGEEGKGEGKVQAAECLALS